MSAANIYRSGYGVAHVPPVPAGDQSSPWWLDDSPLEIAPDATEQDGELVAVTSCEPASESASGTNTGSALPDPATAWQSALDRLGDDPAFTDADMAALRAATVRWDDGEAVEVIVEDGGGDLWEQGVEWTDATPTCPTCGTAAMWLSMTDVWRCQKCDPPRAAMRLLRRAEQARRRLARAAD